MTKTTYGAYLVYANGMFEGEPKTLAGARRMAGKVARLGMVPTIKRHATDGVAHWNEVVA